MARQTPPSSSSSDSRPSRHRSYTPRAPQMGHQALPATPYTAQSPAMHGQVMPAAPHMVSVPLPGPMEFQYGLMTPPATPARQRAQPALHPILDASNLAGIIYFDINFSLDRITFHPVSGYTTEVLSQPATHPPVDRLRISVFFDAIRFEVSNSRGLTVGDVLYQIYEALNRRADPLELSRLIQAKGLSITAQSSATGTAKRIQILHPAHVFAGLSPGAEGYVLQLKA